MSLKYHLFIHILVGFIFSIAFIYGSLQMNYYIDYVNQEKSLFPILVYTNNLSEANDVHDFVNNHQVFSSFYLTYPDSLANLLIEKYELMDFSRAVRGFTLPFLLEIFVNPLPADDLNSFIFEITSFFPNNIIHYNSNIWVEIDSQTLRLRKIFLILQALALGLYLLLQLFIRLAIIVKNKECINAIQNSGITSNKLALKKLHENVLFLFFTSILMILSNLFLNILFINRMSVLSLNMLNLNLLVMLFLINFLFVLFQKPIYSKPL
ncbi:MAG: hypothetical protein FWG98_14475 [Candidatus Cloacimonetes bacterium]|nr:hypothetical protein [Candidatus Cloacimonadota bacterium]